MVRNFLKKVGDEYIVHVENLLAEIFNITSTTSMQFKSSTELNLKSKTINLTVNDTSNIKAKNVGIEAEESINLIANDASKIKAKSVDIEAEESMSLKNKNGDDLILIVNDLVTTIIEAKIDSNDGLDQDTKDTLITLQEKLSAFQ